MVSRGFIFFRWEIMPFCQKGIHVRADRLSSFRRSCFDFPESEIKREKYAGFWAIFSHIDTSPWSMSQRASILYRSKTHFCNDSLFSIGLSLGWFFASIFVIEWYSIIWMYFCHFFLHFLYILYNTQASTFIFTYLSRVFPDLMSDLLSIYGKKTN